MSKHTPVFFAQVTNGGYTGKIVNGNGDTVAIVNNHNQAVLLASAPELLEALKGLIDAMLYKSFHAETDATVKALEVIAKAEGNV